MAKLWNFIIWTNIILPFGCFLFYHLAISCFGIWPFLLVAANKNQYILLVMANKFDKIPILSRMVANVETEPLGSAFAYAGDYVKDMFFIFQTSVSNSRKTSHTFHTTTKQQ